MSKFTLESLPEAFVSTTAMSKAVAAAVAQGRLKRLGTRLYTKNLTDTPEAIVMRNWYYLVTAYFPDALIADRTALENKPAADGSVFIISNKKRDIELPSVTFRPRKGAPALDTDLPFAGGARLSSTARAFLENMRLSRSRDDAVPRTLSRKEIEERLDAIIRRGGETAINKIRDDARAVAAQIGLQEELKKLDELIGGLLGTKDSEAESPQAAARMAGKPYDPSRLKIFDSLFSALRSSAPISRPIKEPTAQENANLSFFEAYFSNFIEGTEFEIEEAVDVVFKGAIPNDRPQDAHDVLGTYRLVSDRREMARVPKNFDEFIKILQHRHFVFMEQRPDKLPGKFKQKTNRAGSSVFVEPDLVTGTLDKGFEFYTALESPLHRAIFMMFLISEVHPFADGNGRAARIMMNAELVAGGEQKIIIPIVYRNNYLTALKSLTHNGHTAPLIRTLEFAQQYTNAIDWSDFAGARSMLEKTNAFIDPVDADNQGIRLVLLGRI
jgi:hypothetical protein